jgi:hypothetical protein
MPITVRQALAGPLGRLAIRAGEVRGQQIQAARDIQLTSIAAAAQSRAWEIDAAARNRAFALQRAGAAQIAKQREVEPDTRAQRQRLQKFVSEAEEAGIYEPAQLKQMQIFANLGDAAAVRSIAGKLSQPTVRRRELQQQLEAVTETGRSGVSKIQRQLDTVNNQWNKVTGQLGKQFTPGTQQLFLERPEYMKTVSPDVQKLLIRQQQLDEQRQQLKGQIAAVTERTAKMGQMIQMGMSIPEQVAFETRQKAQLVKEEDREYRRLVQQTRGIGKLTDREELYIDMIRDEEQGRRTALDREIARLSKELVPFEDEADDPEKHAKRIGPIQGQIQTFRLTRMASFANEKRKVEEFLRNKSKQKQAYTPGQIITGANGRRYRFTRYLNGKPMVKEIE